MAGNELKTPLAQSLNRIGDRRASDAVAALGRGLPCTVVSIQSPGIVTVNFEVEAIPFALPNVTMAVSKHPSIQYPIKEGDPGVALSADLRTGAITGLSSARARLTDTVGNLSAMTFFWLGNTNEVFINPQAVTLIEPTGHCTLQVSPAGVFIEGETGNLTVTGNVSVGTGASGSFVTADGLTVTVQDGIVTNIY